MASLHYFMESNFYTPGMLTNLRSFVTNNNALGALAVKCGIHGHIKNLVGLSLAEDKQKFQLTHDLNHFLLSMVNYIKHFFVCKYSRRLK